MRFIVFGRPCLKNGWVQFDAFLVAVSMLQSLIVEPLVYVTGADESMKGLGFLMVLKVLRLLRLARTVRLFAQFKVLWMLVRGLLGSINTIFFTFIILALLVYVFACVAIELITKAPLRGNDSDFDQLVDLYFKDMWTSMMTLTQFVNLDSIGDIYKQLIPFNYVVYTLIFFGFILIVSVALMNLVTAVIVDRAVLMTGGMIR